MTPPHPSAINTDGATATTVLAANFEPGEMIGFIVGNACSIADSSCNVLAETQNTYTWDWAAIPLS